MSNTQQEELYQKPYDDDEIDLRELFSALWSGKLTIIIATVMAAVIAVSYALFLPNIYKAEALLSPVSSDGSGMGGLASKFGGLASLAGVSLGGGGSGDKTTLGIEVMQSRQFFAQFSQENNVLVPLMAAKGWNSSDNTLVIDPEVFDSATNTWVRQPKPPRQSQPSIQESHEAFKKLISVAQDKDSGFVTLGIEHHSPYVAEKWVSWLIQDVNDALRDNDVAQAERSISICNQKFNNTSLSEMRSSLFDLVQSQTQTIMLANASPEYIFKTLDPAVVPELKAKPKRALIAVLGTMLGGMLGVLIVLVRHFMNKDEGVEA